MILAGQCGNIRLQTSSFFAAKKLYVYRMLEVGVSRGTHS